MGSLSDWESTELSQQRLQSSARLPDAGFSGGKQSLRLEAGRNGIDKRHIQERPSVGISSWSHQRHVQASRAGLKLLDQFVQVSAHVRRLAAGLFCVAGVS